MVLTVLSLRSVWRSCRSVEDLVEKIDYIRNAQTTPIEHLYHSNSSSHWRLIQDTSRYLSDSDPLSEGWQPKNRILRCLWGLLGD